MKIGIIGAGAMGLGIAQVAAQAGHSTVIFDANPAARTHAQAQLTTTLQTLVAKQKITQTAADALYNRIVWAYSYGEFADCGLVIEAIVENLSIKKQVFAEIEKHVAPDCIIATNTSSLSVAAVAAACTRPQRVLGIHFFNPAPIMPLVEIISAVQTDPALPEICKQILIKWGKIPVIAKDTPGFIVNRIARPYYGESLRIFEENIADCATIDAAMRQLGFKMGPFELMDFIGHDVNYAVSESIFTSFYYDRRYLPSFTQKRLVEANYLGKKTGKGFYDYTQQPPTNIVANNLNNHENNDQTDIQNRILAMLINEAIDAVYMQIATATDIDLAMTKGVNYPQGLLAWATQKGYPHWLNILQNLHQQYADDRYRPSILLRQWAAATSI
jgi:3-hydroxybutyryl-CoA dehydrogenase